MCQMFNVFYSTSLTFLIFLIKNAFFNVFYSWGQWFFTFMLWSIELFNARGGLVVNVLDCQSRGSRVKNRPEEKFGLRFLLHLHLLGNSDMMSTLTWRCQLEDNLDKVVRERTGHLPSYAEAKKIMSKIMSVTIFWPSKTGTLFVCFFRSRNGSCLLNLDVIWRLIDLAK